MSRIFLLITLLFVFFVQGRAQSQDPPKFEVAGEFTVLNREDFVGSSAEPGFGGRFTFNLNENIAFEGAGFFFPRRCSRCRNNGRVTQAVGGVKIGKRFDTWGIFAKVRPGIVSFSQGDFRVVQIGPAPPLTLIGQVKSVTSFATDFGGVLEFYPSRRIVTRFDVGDTLIHFSPRTNNFVGFGPDGPFLIPFRTPSRTTHNIQFSTSVGFRF